MNDPKPQRWHTFTANPRSRSILADLFVWWKLKQTAKRDSDALIRRTFSGEREMEKQCKAT